MGKWSAAKYDATLSAKMKSLISGAIERSKLEKTEQCISYQNFVEDLDVGDSFTTTLVDILVQELADRVSRPSARDKASISDRTMRSLRLLAAPARVFRGTNSRAHRRAVNLTDYLQVPPTGVEEENDTLDWMSHIPEYPTLDTGSSAIYDALGGMPWSNGPTGGIQMRDSSPDRSTPGVDAPSPVFMPLPAGTTSRPPPPRSGSWGLVSQSSTSASTTVGLRRRASNIRSARTRANDFSEFSMRRRSHAREESHLHPSIEDAHESDAGPSSLDGTQGTVRRFFPLSSVNSTGHWGSPADWTDNVPSRADLGQSPSPRPWSPPPAAVDPYPLPRLRRGGVRAPEALFSRAVTTPPVLSPTPSIEPALIPGASSSHVVEYPTPNSTDHE